MVSTFHIVQFSGNAPAKPKTRESRRFAEIHVTRQSLEFSGPRDDFFEILSWEVCIKFVVSLVFRLLSSLQGQKDRQTDSEQI